MILDERLKNQLEAAVARINRPEFVAEDPVQFPRMFTATPDIEIAGLLSAVMAWGRRPMILRDCRRLLDLMEWQPAAWVLSGEWRALEDDRNLHRTLFGRHLKWLMRGLRRIYSQYGTLDAFCAETGAAAAEAPAWKFAENLLNICRDENEGEVCPEALPSHPESSALKRINMWLRWMVRRDGLVDPGVWRSLTPAQLFIPLDVHSGRTARTLGLLERKSNDRRAVEQLTEALRVFDPSDPVKYDYALFGLGIEGGVQKVNEPPTPIEI